MKQWKRPTSSGIYNTIYSSGSYLLLFGKRQWISCQIFYK